MGDLEELRADGARNHAFRAPAAGKRELTPPEQHHAVEAVRRPLPVVEVRRRDGEASDAWKRALRRHVEDAYQAIGLVEGQRPQQHGVDDAEDGCVGADAERENRDDGQRERRRSSNDRAL
jgi:hypothetical protein